MAEGRQDFGVDQPGLDHNLDNDGLDDEMNMKWTRPVHFNLATHPRRISQESRTIAAKKLRCKQGCTNKAGCQKRLFDENTPFSIGRI